MKRALRWLLNRMMESAVGRLCYASFWMMGFLFAAFFFPVFDWKDKEAVGG